MKKTYTLLGLTMLCLASCQQIDLGEGQNLDNDGEAGKVTVTSKSGVKGVELPLPFTVYAVDANGNIVEKQTLSDPAEEVQLSLPQEKYWFSAIAGMAASEAEVAKDNTISFENGYALAPVMIATKEKSISTSNSSLAMTLKNAVAAMDVTLADIPENITKVEVEINSVCSALTILNEGIGERKVVLPLVKAEDGEWFSGVRYLLPGVGERTVLTFKHYAGETAVKTFSTTYPYPLKANTPYHFKGTYNGVGKIVSIDYSCEMEGWAQDVDVNFEYGKETEPAKPVGGSAFEVEQLPVQGTVWNGHVLALMNGNEGLLVSLKEWSSQKPDEEKIKAIAAEYSEKDVTGWNIPTEEQASALVSQYWAGNVTALNSLLTEAGGSEVKVVQEPNYFYGDDAQNVFSFYSQKMKIETADPKKKSYRLRLVKPVTFIVK